MAGSLAEHFYRGEYAQIIALLSSRTAPEFVPVVAQAEPQLSEVAFAVAALALAGLAAESEAFFRHKANELSANDICFCRFQLAGAYTRQDNLPRARQFLIENLRVHYLRQATDSKLELFCAFQGLGFYRFYTGRLQLARRAAESAYRLASELDWHYGGMLATELLGQIEGLLGGRGGVDLLAEAGRLAAKQGNANAETKLKTQLCVARARLVLAPEKALFELREQLKTLSPEDRYLAASLRFELARQLGLRGKTAAAKDLLQHTFADIFRCKVRRYEATLDLRYAEVLGNEGQFHQALLHTEAARMRLRKDSDLWLLVEILTRQVWLLDKLGMSKPMKMVKARLTKAARRAGVAVAQLLAAQAVQPGERPGSQALNHRQIQILRYLEKHEFVDVKTVREQFSISEITACRDLSELTRARWVVRIGKARATKYRAFEVRGEAKP